MKFLLLPILFYFFSLSAKAQVDREPFPENNADVMHLNTANKIYGKDETVAPIGASTTS